MLIRLTKACGWRGAAIIAVLYAVCVLAPTAAMAFGDSARAAHCLTENHHAVGKQAYHGTGEASATEIAHAHDSGIAHKHSKSANTGSDNGDCCGLMCLFTMPGSMTAETKFARSPTPLPAVIASIDGLGAGPLFKPPKS